MTPLVGVFAGAASSAVVLTQIVRAVAGRLSSPERHGDRRLPTPRLGGIAIALTWAGTILVISRFGNVEMRATLATVPLVPLLTGSLLVFAVGLLDDLRPLSAGIKVATEALAACAVIGAGVVIHRVTIGGATFDLGWLSAVVTMAWIIGITNAFNLMDGLDGLATGLAIISGVTCTAIVMIRGDIATTVLLVALLGALVGFLPFNFNPASIFLGDSGSLFVGFVLAFTAITGFQKGATALASGIPLLIFALPLVDIISTVIRRLHGGPPVRTGRILTALTRLVQPDREHIHHRLMSRGLSQKSAVLVLYAIAVCLAGVAFVTAQRP